MKIAIIGGGVGGLTAATALNRKGFDVTVFEQSPTSTQLGASVQLGPNALRLMDEFGLLSELRTVGVRPDAVEFLRWDDGALLLHVELGEAAEAYFSAPQLDFFRPDLNRVLTSALPEGVLQLGMPIARVNQNNEGVTLLAADGQRFRADIAVAADGIRSKIRQQLLGADRPQFSGTVVYRGVVPYESAVDLHPFHHDLYWIGPHRHGVSYWIASGRMLAVNCAVQEADWSRESWTLEAPREEAAAAFEGWHAPLLDRIDRIATTLRGAVFVRSPLEHWSFDRVTLLGDAAHAMEPFQGQGAAQAVEDAYVLAECLATDSSPCDALRRYERIRMTRAEELQESSSAAAGVFYLPDGEEQRRRDARYATLGADLPFGPRQPIWEYDVRTVLATVG